MSSMSQLRFAWKKKILTEAKAVRHGEMKAIQKQLDHLK